MSCQEEYKNLACEPNMDLRITSHLKEGMGKNPLKAIKSEDHLLLQKSGYAHSLFKNIFLGMKVNW